MSSEILQTIERSDLAQARQIARYFAEAAIEMGQAQRICIHLFEGIRAHLIEGRPRRALNICDSILETVGRAQDKDQESARHD